MAAAPSLPKTFALKSPYNNKYLSYVYEEGEVYGLLKFTADNVTVLSTFQVEPAKSGDGKLVHIKCCYNNKYWRRWSPNHYWISAEADQPEEDQSKWSCTLFKPLFLGPDPNTFQLWHVQLGHYACSWRAGEPYTYGLFAAVSTPDGDKLDVYSVTEFADPVASEVKDIEFNLNNAKISGQTTVELATGIAVNRDETSAQTKVVTLEYNKSESGTWKVGSSMNTNVVMTKIKSPIPAIVKGIAQLSGDEFSGPYEWGKTVETEYGVETKYNVIVPPNSRVMVTLSATQASVDVPFSYTQGVTLANGTELTAQKMVDGVYKGNNLFNFRYEPKVTKN